MCVRNSKDEQLSSVTMQIKKLPPLPPRVGLTVLSE